MPSKEQFIQSLCTQLKPVKRLASPETRMLTWSGITLVFVVAMLTAIGPYRQGFMSQFGINLFTVETLSALLSLFFASYIVFKMNIPGVPVSGWGKALGFIPVSLFLGFLLYGIFVEPSLEPSMAGKRPHCVLEVLIFCMPPLAFLLYQLRKGYSHYDVPQFMLIGLAASSVPIAVMQVACMYNPMHILRYHLGPGLVVTALVSVFGAIWVRVHRPS